MSSGPTKSVKLREAASRNWRKARAEGTIKPWRGFRSVREGRLLRSLVWQWLRQAPDTRCSMRKLARRLGCDRSWIRQLRRSFKANPEQQRKREELHGPATWAEFNEERNKRLSDLCRFSLYRQPRIRRKPIKAQVVLDGDGRVLYDPAEIERQLRRLARKGAAMTKCNITCRGGSQTRAELDRNKGLVGRECNKTRILLTPSMAPSKSLVESFGRRLTGVMVARIDVG